MMDDDFIDGDPFDPEVAVAVENQAYEAVKHDKAAIEQHLQRSKQAYTRLFVEGNATKDDVAFVMHDLAWFCKAYDPLWQHNPRQQDRMVARREVYQRIMEYTRLDHNTLMKRYAETQN